MTWNSPAKETFFFYYLTSTLSYCIINLPSRIQLSSGHLSVFFSLYHHTVVRRNFKRNCSYFNQSKNIVIISGWRTRRRSEFPLYVCTTVKLYDGGTETVLSALLSTNHRKALLSILKTGVMIGWKMIKRFSFH